MELKQKERIARARQSLEGLSVADAHGRLAEFTSPNALARRVEARWLPESPWQFTDDTNMALSIYAVLREYGEINQDALVESLVGHYEHGRRYGAGMRHLLRLIRKGAPWREAAQGMFLGQGSYGNGAAMRIPPLGAYFADDMDALVEQACLSAEVTHAHTEAAAGAAAVAAAAAKAWHMHGDEPPTRAEFIDMVLPYIPESEVHDGAIRARDLPPGTEVEAAVETLGNGTRVSCQDTVPYVLWCAGEQLEHYEAAFWLTMSGGGDADTTCAMVGGIVVMYTGADDIPKEWLRRREPLPDWPF